MEKPFLIVIHGPMGAGKTTAARALHDQLPRNAHVVQTEIKKLITGYVPGEQIAGIPEITYDLVASFLKQDIAVISECVVNDATLEAYQELAKEQDAQFCAARLVASREVRWQRVCARTAEMMNVEVLPEAKVIELEGIFATNDAFYNSLQSKIGMTINTDEHNREAVISQILGTIK